MPTVPRLTPQVAPQQLPGARITVQSSPEDFGAGLGRGLLAVGEVAQREQQRADETLMQEADNELYAVGKDLRGNPESGYLLKKGRDAFGLSATVSSEWDKRVAETEKKMTSPRAKQAFAILSARRKQQLLADVDDHTLREGEAYEKAQNTSAATLAIDEARSFYHDPARLAAALAKGEEAVARLNKGAPPEALEQAQAEFRSTLHTQVLDGMIASKDYKRARIYFDEVKGELRGKDLAGAERSIHEVTLRDAKTTAFDAILAKHPGDYKAQIAAARKIDDPEVRDAVESELDQNRARDEAIKNQTERDLSDWAWNGAIDGNLKGRDDIPADRWAAMAPETKKGLTDYWQGKAAGKDIVTDTTVYYALEEMAAGRPEEFQGEDLLKYANALSPTDLKRFIRIQQTGRDENGVTVFELRSKDQVVKDLWSGAGMDPSPKDGSKGAKQYAAFKSALDADLKAFQSATGKKPTSTDIEEAGKKLLIRGYVQRDWLPDPDRFRFEATPDQKVTVDPDSVSYQDVPVRERKAIEAALAKRNIPVTEANVTQLYVRGLNGGAE